jgi:hypothetical protein
MTDAKIFVTSDARAQFCNRDLSSLTRDFAAGDVRSVVALYVWSDGVMGGNYHIESPAERQKLVRYLRKIAADLEKVGR